MKKLMLLAAAAMLGAAAPAVAQDSSYTPGSYWDVSMLDVEDGQSENYADWLAANWKRQQEFAKSKGWIEDYHVLANAYARDGEPDLYLMVKYREMPTRADELKREKEYLAFMESDWRKLDAASAQRVKMRTAKGSMLLREMQLK